MHSFFDLILHFDTHLEYIINHYGIQTYLILFLIVFAETGLVVTPFLPGDSLLFAAGLFAAKGSLNTSLLFIVFICAALTGDNVNYLFGKTLGRKLFKNPNSKFFKSEHLERTHEFYEKYGGKTIIMARFVAVVRTFAPFVAGIGAMTYKRFLVYSIGAAILWVSVCVGAGYLLGNVPLVRDHFTIAVLFIVFFSVIPASIEMIRSKRSVKPDINKV